MAIYFSSITRKTDNTNVNMKKTLLLAVCMATTLASAAQTNRTFPDRKSRSVLRPHPTPITYASDRAIIWEDDLSSAATWTFGDIADPNDDHWTIGTDEPQGPFSSTYGAIESTSAANGFALFDSDFLCGGSQHAWVQTATPIDLSSYPGAVLQFEQYFTRFRGDCFVDVSINGTDWTEFEVNADVAVNASTANPELTQIDISSVVANQATVWIRFRYFSTVAVHGAGSGCDYAWMVDDVAVIELQPYELVMNYGVISHTGAGEEYGRVPSDQLNPQMNFGAEVHNFGSEDQTGLSVHVLVTDAGSTIIFEQSFGLGDLAAGQLANLDELVTLPAMADGVYDVSFTVTSNETGLESDPANNSTQRQFAIDGDVYALDGIDVYDSNVLTGMGSTSFAGAADGLEIMTYYELAAPATVYGVSAELANGTEVNSAVIVSLHDTAQVFNNNLNTPIAQSDVISVTAADLAAGRVLGLFLPAVDLAAGGYYASVRLLSGANEFDIFVLDDITVPQPGGGSLIYDPSDQTVYANGNASAVRLQLNPTVGVNDLGSLEGVSMYPNPTSGLLRINSPHAGQHMVEVRSALGEVIMSTRFSQTVTMDLTALAKGVYMVQVSHGSGSWVQRVAVN